MLLIPEVYKAFPRQFESVQADNSRVSRAELTVEKKTKEQLTYDVYHRVYASELLNQQLLCIIGLKLSQTYNILDALSS